MGRYVLGSGGPHWNGIPMIGLQPDVSGETFFVDGSNGSDGYTGKSWSQPLKTLKKAISLSNISIAISPNRRNTIFLVGNPIVEDLVVFPDKTDIIGCGSYMMSKHAGILGKHIPISGQGTRFYSCRVCIGY